MEYTKNTNPHYYEENQNCSNCGSFAFQIEEWSLLDEYFEEDMGVSVEEWIDNCIWNGCDEGMWLEKCGSDPTRFCEKDDWHNGLMEYISYTSYFARKLTN